MRLDRRDFLTSAAATAAGLTLAGGSKAFAAKDAAQIRVGQIGVRSQGNNHLRSLGAQVFAICDVDQQVLEDRAASYTERVGHDVERFTDYREMLEKADVDAVSIATPNHTHSLIAIAAIEAGKDVYVEKPVSHNVWEGRQLVAAARKHNQLVQCGTQSRSSPSLQAAVKWVQGGGLGEIQYAIGTCYKPRKAIGQRAEPLAIPDTLNYDLWCGPAEKRELMRPQLHYDWHWDWNTGNGDMGNQGIHQMDIARWFLGEDRLAPRTVSVGGRLGYEDAADTPNTQVVYHAYEKAPLIFETRGLPRSKAAQAKWGDSMDRFRGSGIGVIVQCEGGHVVIPSYSQAIAYDRTGAEVKGWQGGANHHQNWLGAIAAGDPAMLSGEIQEGHLSSALCHTGGVSHLLGEQTVASDIAERFAGDPLMSSSLERMLGHLRANDVDVDSDPGALTLGPWLEVDTETEQFVGNEAADALRTREYRAPFRVPDLGA